MVKQVGLLAAGCQPWNNDVCAASEDLFAYCATLAVYIYQRDKFNEYSLHSIMSEHKKTITSIGWNPRNKDQFVTAGVDNQVIVWDVVQQRVLGRLQTSKETPRTVGWCSQEPDTVAFMGACGPLVIWKYKQGEGTTSCVKDSHNFMSEVCQHRWHPKKTGRIGFGHQDGSISVINLGQKSHKHLLQPDTGEAYEEDRVTALEWDPLSLDYILVSNLHTGVRLLDTTAPSVIMTFQLPSAAAHVHTLSWMPNAPGIFITGDSHSGVLRVWNVSKSTPLENLKLKKTGFHCLYMISEDQTAPLEPGLASKCHLSPKSHLSSTSVAVAPSSSNSSHLALPPTNVVCTFLDGGVGLYNMGHRKWKFLREKGHMETIFDCEFKPDDPDILATASFDGTIKVWDVNTLTAINTSPGNEGVIYCISWAPADLNCVVACTSKHAVFIWDIGRGKIAKRFLEHGRASVYSVAWSKKDSGRIMSCGADGYCIVRQIDGTLIQKYKHPGAVFGCDWSPHNKDMLATGCEDKNVRVYYLATSQDQALKVFSGHSSKVFRVRWSPLREGILCSGSDDGSIRIWDYTQEACVNVLSGHTAPVRGLLWNSEVPYLLISGSWDYSIRIWDTRDGACVDTVLDHGADVYGLTSHPSRPFVLASSSRDSTVRIWSLTSLVQPIEMHLIVQHPWEVVIGPIDRAMSQGSIPLLTGKVSKELVQQIDRLQGNVYSRTLRLFSKFFTHPAGTSNLWELVSVVMGLDDSLLSTNYSKGIMHVRHLSRVMASEAQQLEMIKMAKFGGGIGAPTKEDSLKSAAQLHIKLGNIQRYCELMVGLGQWEKALAVSPGVSMEYWTSLSKRYADFLIREDNDSALPFCMATRDTSKLVHFLISKGQMKDALLVAQVSCEDDREISQTPSSNSGNCVHVNGVEEPSQEKLQLLSWACEELADSYFRKGCPTLSACCHLAISDTQNALRKLIRGNELELAASIGKVLGKEDLLTHLAIEFLARRCEDLGKWELAVDMLQMISDNDLQLAQLCARCAASMDEINLLHNKAGFPSMDECAIKAEKLLGQGDIFGCVKFYIMSTTPEQGLQIGLQKVKEVMLRDGWKVDDVVPLLHMMAAVKTEKLVHHTFDRWRSELLCLCAYTGALLAIKRQYDGIVAALFQHAQKMVRKGKADVPLSEELLEKECQAWMSHNTQAYTRSGPSGEAASVDSDIYLALMEKVGEENSPLGAGPDCVASSHLPSHSDVHMSYLTGKRIQGHAFFLEDGNSAISINEALMWAKVNPFSPLGSGLRINPF
ncbi:WD repeat-containing protein 17-like isoform X2 [Liolophura sinensis]|uniref:WD repeat-containing protein 17-like isoform X2 n=1 Tax=Liolophura sinensis TaxID=3198878 RepID=UPI003158108A